MILMRTTHEQMRTALASAYPLTILVSMEEERQEQLLERFGNAAKPNPLPLAIWNCVDGFLAVGPEGMDDPMAALKWIADSAPQGLYLFKDIGEFLDDRRAPAPIARHRHEDPRHRSFSLHPQAERRASRRPQTAQLCGHLALPR